MNIIFEALQDAGYEAYLVGGAVRDITLGHTPKDYDYTTNARPEDVVEIFESLGYSVIPTGIKFGTVTLMIKGVGYEITTFRKDVGGDGRRPGEVVFSNSLQEDLSRRDFTINAMAMDRNGAIIDPFHGQKDLKSGIIRAVGNPEERIREDGLRTFRAIRFASRYNFSIEESLKKAILENLHMVEMISGERIYQEVSKILLSSPNEELFILLSELLWKHLPELKISLNTTQYHPYHSYDVGRHTLKVVQASALDEIQVFSALLHDMGKPEVKTLGLDGYHHFQGHQEVSVFIAKRFLQSLRCSTEFIKNVTWLVDIHDAMPALTPKAVRRFLSKYNVDTEEKMKRYIDFKIADASGQNKAFFFEKLAAMDKLWSIYEELGCETISVKSLAVNGHDLRAIGFRGAEIGAMLRKLLDKVLDNPSLNNKNTLLSLVEEEKGA